MLYNYILLLILTLIYLSYIYIYIKLMYGVPFNYVSSLNIFKISLHIQDNNIGNVEQF